jgi:hypothetical protein
MGVTEPGTPWHGISVAPIFFWELIVGLWMTFKGFNRSAPIVMAAMAARAGAQSGSTTGAPSAAAVTAKAGAA